MKYNVIYITVLIHVQWEHVPLFYIHAYVRLRR